MSSTTKRVFTDESYKNMQAQQSRNDPTPADIALRLQNMGHIRKNVTEGYATDRYCSTSSSHRSFSTEPSRSESHLVFRSANDTLRDVFSSTPLGHCPPPSPRKRTRSTSDDSQAHFTINDDEDTEMQNVDAGSVGEDAISASRPATSGERPMKPLRRSRRPFRETRSLPVGLLRFPGDKNDRDALSNVDDDWSLPGFQLTEV